MIAKLIYLLIFGPYFFYPFSICPFKLPYLYCLVCPTRCFWHHVRGFVLLGIVGLSIYKDYFCSKVCPFGTIQQILFKTGFKKILLPKKLVYLKHVFLVLVTYIIVATKLPELQTVSIAVKLRTPLFTIFILSLVFSLFNYRFFCNHICPIKALNVLVHKVKKTMKTFLKLLLVLLIFATIGCESKVTSQKTGLTIVSLAPSITEILFALGLENNIVGVTTQCNYPREAQSIEQVATFSGQANLEKITILNPDIIFSTGLEQSPTAQKLKKIGFKVVLVYPESLEQLFGSILEIGKLTDKQDQANALVENMRAEVVKIKHKLSKIPEQKRPKVFIEISPDPLITAGKGSFVDELIKCAGGVNIAYDTQRPYSQFSPELVIQRNPDFIILGYMYTQKKDSMQQRIGWSEITAVKQGQVISNIHPDLLLRPGPRLIQGLKQIHSQLFD